MTCWLKVWAFCIAITIFGCSHLPIGTDWVATVDRLIQRQEFAKAERILARLNVDDSQYRVLKSRRRTLSLLKKQFEKKSVARALTLKARYQWVEALQVVNKGLRKIPKSKVLGKAKKRLLAGRRNYIDDIEHRLQLLESKTLPEKRSLLQKRADATPSNIFYQWALYYQNSKASALIKDFIQCATLAQKKGDFDTSFNCLAAAEAIAKTPETTRALTRLRAKLNTANQLAQKRGKSKRRAKKKAKRELIQLKQQYRDLVAAGWWIEAKEKMTELRAKAPRGDKELNSWRVELERVIKSRVKSGLEHGQLLYSQGFLLQALNVWLEAAVLAPDHAKLQAHIDRVERFLNKLDKLHSGEG